MASPKVCPYSGQLCPTGAAPIRTPNRRRFGHRRVPSTPHPSHELRVPGSRLRRLRWRVFTYSIAVFEIECQASLYRRMQLRCLENEIPGIIDALDLCNAGVFQRAPYLFSPMPRLTPRIDPDLGSSLTGLSSACTDPPGRQTPQARTARKRTGIINRGFIGSWDGGS